MRRTLFATIVGLSWLSTPSVHADPPFRYPEGKSGQAELRYRSGVPVLTVAGSPDEIGTQIGTLALGPGRRIASYPEELLSRFYVGYMYGTALKSGSRMVERFPAERRAELDAMARAADVSRDKLVVANTLFDLKKIVACSALLVESNRSATGGTLMARNLDFATLGYAHEYGLVTVYRPQGAKHAFATVGFPGLVGCLSGMNDAGLAVAILEAEQVKVNEPWLDATGTPYAICYRRLLEECATIGEAFDLLSKMKRATISNLVIADRQSVAVFEVTPRRVVLRRGSNGTSICTNHFCSDELRPRVPIDFVKTQERFTMLEKLSQMQKKLGTAELHVAMHAVSAADTMQTMIFEPATLRLHVSIGSVPASAAELRTLELEPLFRGKGD